MTYVPSQYHNITRITQEVTTFYAFLCIFVSIQSVCAQKTTAQVVYLACYAMDGPVAVLYCTECYAQHWLLEEHPVCKGLKEPVSLLSRCFFLEQVEEEDLTGNQLTHFHLEKPPLNGSCGSSKKIVYCDINIEWLLPFVNNKVGTSKRQRKCFGTNGWMAGRTSGPQVYNNPVPLIPRGPVPVEVEKEKMMKIPTGEYSH